MQNAGMALKWAYQSAVYVAQDEESKDSLMQEMRRRKGTSVHILYGCSTLEKLRMQTLGFARMNPEKIKKARLSGIMALGKGAGLLNSSL